MHALIFQLATTSFLTGLIWVTQCITYPAFAWIDPKRALEYFKVYQRKIAWIVIPLMLAEALCAIYLSWNHLIPIQISIGNLFSIAIIWIFTFVESIKRHRSLLEQYDRKEIKRLIQGNWVRTFVWSFRSLFILALIIS